MKNIEYYKILFLIGGIWNIGAAISCWIGSIFIPSLFFKMFGMPSPASLFPFHAMFWFIMTFGIGYIMVSRDISKNHGVILIGMLGKIIFFIDCLTTLLLKEANIMLLFTGIVDLVFAILFIDFLLKSKKLSIQTTAKQ
jgi:hypothetical protein